MLCRFALRAYLESCTRGARVSGSCHARCSVFGWQGGTVRSDENPKFVAAWVVFGTGTPMAGTWERQAGPTLRLPCRVGRGTRRVSAARDSRPPCRAGFMGGYAF